MNVSFSFSTTLAWKNKKTKQNTIISVTSQEFQNASCSNIDC